MSMNATKQNNKGNTSVSTNKKNQQTQQSVQNSGSTVIAHQNKHVQSTSANLAEKETLNSKNDTLINNPETKNYPSDSQPKKPLLRAAAASAQQNCQFKKCNSYNFNFKNDINKQQNQNSKNQPIFQKNLRSHAQQIQGNSGKSSLQKTPKEKVGLSDKTFKNYESNMTSTSPDRFEDTKQKVSPNPKIIEAFEKDQPKSLQQVKTDKNQSQQIKSTEQDESIIIKSKENLTIDTSGKDQQDCQQSAALAQKKLTMVLRDPSKRKSTKKWDSQESEEIFQKPQKEAQQKSGNQKEKSQKSSVQKSQISEFPLQKVPSQKKTQYSNPKQGDQQINPEKLNQNQIMKLEKNKSASIYVQQDEQKEENDEKMQEGEIYQIIEDQEDDDDIDEEEEEDQSDMENTESDQEDLNPEEDQDNQESSGKDHSQTSDSKVDLDKDLRKRRKLAFMKEQSIANRALRIKMGKSGAQAATRKNIKKGKDACQRKLWDQPEDDAIVQLVAEHGTKRWTYIAQQLTDEYKIGGRTGKQCRERWHNHLDPSIKKSPINSIEEKIIFDAHKVYGNKWADIAKLLDGRSDNCIKNYYYSTLRKHIRRINKSLKQCQVAKRLNLKIKTLTADILFPLVKDGKISYNQVKSIDPKKFEDLEHTMRMIFNHEDGQQVTQRGIIAANQNRLKVEMKLEEMRMNELKEQQDITDKRKFKKSKTSDDKDKRKITKQISCDSESIDDDNYDMNAHQKNISKKQIEDISEEIEEKKGKNKSQLLGKRKLSKNLQNSSEFQKSKRQKTKQIEQQEESQSSKNSDIQMKDCDLTQTEEDQNEDQNLQEISKKIQMKTESFKKKKHDQKNEQNIGEFTISQDKNITISGIKNEQKQSNSKKQILNNEMDYSQSPQKDDQLIKKLSDDSSKGQQKQQNQNNDKKAGQIINQNENEKGINQNTQNQSLSTLLQKNINSCIIPGNSSSAVQKQQDQTKSLNLKQNFKNEQQMTDGLKMQNMQQITQQEQINFNNNKMGMASGHSFGMPLPSQHPSTLMSIMNHHQGYKQFGSAMPFHPFSLQNPPLFKSTLNEQNNLDLQLFAQRQHKQKKLQANVTAENENGDASKQKSSSHQHHSSHRSNKKKKKNKKDKKKSHRERGERGLFGLDSRIDGLYYDFSKQRSSSRYPSQFMPPGPIFGNSYINDYAAYNSFIENNYGNSMFSMGAAGNHGILGSGMMDMMHINKNMASQQKLFNPFSHPGSMYDPNIGSYLKSKNLLNGSGNMQQSGVASSMNYHPGMIPSAPPAGTSSGLHPHLQQFFMHNTHQQASSGKSSQEQPNSFNQYPHGGSGPLQQPYLYPSAYFPGVYFPYDPHHLPPIGATGQQAAPSGISNIFLPNSNQTGANQESNLKINKNNSSQDQGQSKLAGNSFKSQYAQGINDNEKEKEKRADHSQNINYQLKKSDQKSDNNLIKNDESQFGQNNSDLKLDAKKSVKSIKSSPTRQKSLEDETKNSKSQNKVKEDKLKKKIDFIKTQSDIKNKKSSDISNGFGEPISEQTQQNPFYGPGGYNHQMQQLHQYFQKNGHYPPGIGMPMPYPLMGLPPFYHMVMHPGMQLMPHPHPFPGAQLYHKQDLDNNDPIHQGRNGKNSSNQQNNTKKDQNYQQNRGHSYYHNHRQFEMPATPINVKQQTFTIKDLFYGAGGGQTPKGQGNQTPKQAFNANRTGQQSNLSQNILNKTSGNKDTSTVDQQQKVIRNEQLLGGQDQNLKKPQQQTTQEQHNQQTLQNQPGNGSSQNLQPAQYNNTITFMINNFASGPVGASSQSVGAKINDSNQQEANANFPKSSSENLLMVSKQQKSGNNTAIKFHKTNNGDQSSQKDKFGQADHQDGHLKNDKSPQSLSPKKQFSQKLVDGTIKALTQINNSNVQNPNSISQSFKYIKQQISIGQLKDFQRKQVDFFNSRGVTPNGGHGAIPLISTSNFLLGGGVPSQNIAQFYGLSAAPMMLNTSQMNANQDRQQLINEKNHLSQAQQQGLLFSLAQRSYRERRKNSNDNIGYQGIFNVGGQKQNFFQSKIFAGTPRLQKRQDINNGIIQRGRILHQSVTPKGNGLSKSQLTSAALLNELQQEKNTGAGLSVQKQNSQAIQQIKQQLLQSSKHFNLNSGHTFNGNSGGFGNNSRVGSKLNTRTNAQVVNNNATSSKIHTIITPKVSTMDKDPEIHKKILDKILKSGSNNQFYDYNGFGVRNQLHGGAMTDSKLKIEEEMGGAFTKKSILNNNQSYGSRENINLLANIKKSESAGKDMLQQKQNEKLIKLDSGTTTRGNMKLDINATGYKSGKQSSNQRDADIQERDSLGLFHINHQAISQNLALNQEPLSSIYTGAPIMNKDIFFGIGMFQQNNNYQQQAKQYDAHDNFQGDFSIQNISALQTPLLGQQMIQEELDQENGINMNELNCLKNQTDKSPQKNTKAFEIGDNEQSILNQNEFQTLQQDTENLIMQIEPVNILQSRQFDKNFNSSNKKNKTEVQIEHDSILDPSEDECDFINEKNENMNSDEKIEILEKINQDNNSLEVLQKVANEDQEMDDCSQKDIIDQCKNINQN